MTSHLGSHTSVARHGIAVGVRPIGRVEVGSSVPPGATTAPGRLHVRHLCVFRCLTISRGPAAEAITQGRQKGRLSGPSFPMCLCLRQRLSRRSRLISFRLYAISASLGHNRSQSIQRGLIFRWLLLAELQAGAVRLDRSQLAWRRT